MRSRVRLNFSPVCSRVCALPSAMPYRYLMIPASRSVSSLSSSSICWSKPSCTMAFSWPVDWKFSAIPSPASVSVDSSFSKGVTSSMKRLILLASFTLMPMDLAISSISGSRPN